MAFLFEDENWLNKQCHFCPELTNREWDRLVGKSMREAVDLSIRLQRRRTLLDEGVRRVPKHRLRKNPLNP